MKNLIYIVAMSKSDHVMYMTNNLVKSLGMYGKYKGKIVILTDDQRINKHIYNADIDIVFIKEPKYRGQGNSKYKVMLLDLYPDAINYDNVMYLDIDIFIMNDINLLFNNNENIVLHDEREYGHTFINRHFLTYIYTYYFVYFRGTEIFLQSDDAKKTPINSGQIIIPKKYIKFFFDGWKETLFSKVHEDFIVKTYDQASLNYFIYNNSVKYDLFNSKFGENCVRFSRDISYKDKGCVINHYAGNHSGSKYTELQNILFNEHKGIT